MAKTTNGKIIKVAGPLVVAEGMSGAQMFEVVRVGQEGLVGEIIALNGSQASIQVYEETAGIAPGEEVKLTGEVMVVELGPGILEQFYDGIQRPLKLIEEQAKDVFITRGIDVPKLDRDRKWEFVPVVKKGQKVVAGDILGTVKETTLIEHKVMVPYGVEGEVKDIVAKGKYTVIDDIATVGKDKVQMLQKWPIRNPRKVNTKLVPSEPLITGTRTLDTFFPIMKGGAGCIPGPFGAGKTVTQQGLAKYCDAQVIVYIGCGERGNEMTDVLKEFPELKDPNTGEPLMKRTVLIANTSNMPVAAREASVYTGITIAEYYRDMGYNVALMADSTSRWAEAMREMSGRLEEMPGEEGYPAYLGSRTAQFYERAGSVKCLGSDGREGSLTVIGAVSPPGGDLSEPVTQNTLRVTKVFWSLDASLAYKRHFPAIHWLRSYSLYLDNMKQYVEKNVAEDYMAVRNEAMNILQEEEKLNEIVQLVGLDALSGRERLTLETAKSLREDFLFQNAFDPEDAYCSIKKDYLLLKLILSLHHACLPLTQRDDFDFKTIADLKVKQDIARAHFIKEGDWAKFAEIEDKIKKETSNL